MHPAFDAGERQFLMKMRGGRDRHGIDPSSKQRRNATERGTAERLRNEIALLAVRVRHADELDAGEIAEDAGMVTAHDAHADHTYAQWTVRVEFRGLHHGRRNPPAGSRSESLSSMPAGGWRWPRFELWTRFEIKELHLRPGKIIAGWQLWMIMFRAATADLADLDVISIKLPPALENMNISDE